MNQLWLKNGKDNMNETSKSVIRRCNDARYASRYFIGKGIDIGAGSDSLSKYKKLFPLITDITSWDVNNGDATYMRGIDDSTYDFVHSSHCLEHLNNPYQGFENWLRICKSDGYLIITIPDEDLYEHNMFPSRFNPDHKFSWSIIKDKSTQSHINLLDFFQMFKKNIKILKIELIDSTYLYNEPIYDQTAHSISESAIEIIIKKI